MIPGIESMACGPLAVPEDVMAHVVHVESSRNPYAIGVVGGRLLRQPRSLDEAVATVRMLEARGYNYSIGLAQVNRSNFERFGLDTPEAGFDVCNNLAAGAKILAECLQRHDGRWGDAFSCYYSGNARTGYEHGYVQKVFAAMSSDSPSTGADAIALAPGRMPLSPQESPSAAVAATPWDAVYAARITAPSVSRFDAVSRETPLVDRAVDRPIEAIPSASPVTDPATPEARFVAEMQQEASRLARHAYAEPVVNPSVGTAMTEPSTSPGDSVRAAAPRRAATITQQESNSSGKDAARVF